jgi:hypothetical protein
MADHPPPHVQPIPVRLYAKEDDVNQMSSEFDRKWDAVNKEDTTNYFVVYADEDIDIEKVSCSGNTQHLLYLLILFPSGCKQRYT